MTRLLLINPNTTASRRAAVAPPGVRVLDLDEDPDAVAKAIEAAGRRAIEAGAEVVPLAESLVSLGLRTRLAESLVSLGLRTSKIRAFGRPATLSR
jgi:hypothetical protein